MLLEEGFSVFNRWKKDYVGKLSICISEPKGEIRQFKNICNHRSRLFHLRPKSAKSVRDLKRELGKERQQRFVD